MAEDTRRPGTGNGAEVPSGMRARNRTMIMGSEGVTSLRTSMERPAPVVSQGQSEPQPVSREGSTRFSNLGGDDYVTPTGSDADAFQSLDDIFGIPSSEEASPLASEEPQGRRDLFEFEAPQESAVSSSAIGQGDLEDDFQSVLGAFDSQEVAEAVPPAPLGPPKIVRPSSVMAPPPTIEEPEITDPFDAIPFDRGFDSVSEASVAPVNESENSDLDVILSDVQEDEIETPIVNAAPVGVARIVRAGDSSRVHEEEPYSQQIKSDFEEERNIHEARKEAETMTEPRDQIFWKTESPLVGFLVTYDHDPKGTYVELRQGRLIVSNQREESGSSLVVLGDMVSPMHAIMRVVPGGIIQVLDQLSEAGTRVKHIGQSEEEFLSGEKAAVSHGDIIYFGDRKFYVLLVLGDEE